MKYKVGDKVKVREDLEVGKGYNNCTFIRDMKKYKGEIATITYCYDDGSYDIDLDEGAWFWTDDMFEDVIESEDIIKTIVTPDTVYTAVDVGFHLDYCGHRVIQNVYYGGYAHDHNHVFCTTTDSKNQYTLPIDAIDFIIPHEVD